MTWIILLIAVEIFALIYELYRMQKQQDAWNRMFMHRIRVIQRIMLREANTRRTIEEAPLSTFGEIEEWQQVKLHSINNRSDSWK